MPNQKSNQKRNQVASFYLALGVCLLALALAIYFGVSSMVSEVEQQIIEAPDSTVSVDTTKDDVVVQEDTTVEEEPTDTQEETQEVVATSTEVTPLYFSLPLEGTIINAFSDGELVKSETLNEWRTHNGVDIAAAANTPVASMADGIVESVVEDALWGMTITISHNDGYQSVYKGLKDTVEVDAGDQVVLGSIIGYVGNTAEIEIAEESHLHVEVLKDGSYVDPVALTQK